MSCVILFVHELDAIVAYFSECWNIFSSPKSNYTNMWVQLIVLHNNCDTEKKLFSSRDQETPIRFPNFFNLQSRSQKFTTNIWLLARTLLDASNSIAHTSFTLPDTHLGKIPLIIGKVHHSKYQDSSVIANDSLRLCFFGSLKWIYHSHPPSNHFNPYYQNETNFNPLQPISTHFNPL